MTTWPDLRLASDEGSAEAVHLSQKAEDLLPEYDPDASGDLVVSRPPGVHPASDGSHPRYQLGLDRLVDVLPLPELLLIDFVEARHDLGKLLRCDQAPLFQHHQVGSIHQEVRPIDPSVRLPR